MIVALRQARSLPEGHVFLDMSGPGIQVNSGLGIGVKSFFEMVLFAFMQIVLFIAFYRIIIRPLPDRINDVIFRKHLSNDFTEVASDVAALVRSKLLDLEEQRFDALVSHAALKGKRLNVSESEKRAAYLRTARKLDVQIKAVHAQLNVTYGTDVMKILRRIEENRAFSVLNAYLDERKLFGNH